MRYIVTIEDGAVRADGGSRGVAAWIAEVIGDGLKTQVSVDPIEPGSDLALVMECEVFRS